MTNEIKRTKELVPGKTVIAQGKTRRVVNGNNVEVDFSMFYGNVMYIAGKKGRTNNNDLYMRFLDDFLNGKKEGGAGLEYIIPTEEEINQAYLIANDLIKPEPAKSVEDTQQVEEIHDPEEKPEEQVEDLVENQEEDQVENQEAQTKEPEIISNTTPKEQKKRVESKKNKKYFQARDINTNLILSGITGASLAAAIFFALMAKGTIPNPFQSAVVEEEKTIAVVQLAHDVSQGDVLLEQDMEKVVITYPEYEALTNGTVVKGDGTTEEDKVLLWDNRAAAYGKFITQTAASGEYLMTSDYTVLSESDKVVTITVDGQEVKVPVAVTTAGSTDIRIYAIATSGLEDGTTRSVAVNLGELKLDGRSLSDILNSDDKSILDELLKHAASEEKKDEE